MGVDAEELEYVAQRLERMGTPLSAQIVRDAISKIEHLRAQNVGGDVVRWQSMETAPHGRPVLARQRADRMPGGVWVATVILNEDGDHWTDGDTILHYNGGNLLGGFRGTWTHWAELPVDQKCGAACGVNPQASDNLEAGQGFTGECR